MTYSLWFPTHKAESACRGGWFRRFFQQPPYKLDRERQTLVARSLAELCADRGWRLISVEPGEREVVAVVESDLRPERVVHDFKITANLALASLDGHGPHCKRFNRRARVRYLSPRRSVIE